MKKKYLLILIVFFIGNNLTQAQVAINNNGNSPNASAMLDVQSTTSGLLIPRMTAEDRDNISSPATGLTVYVTDDNHFYYFDGTSWVPIQNADSNTNNAWSVTGNAGLNSSNFLGTTDAQSLIIKTNNIERLRINESGVIGLNVAPENNVLFYAAGNTYDNIAVFENNQPNSNVVALTAQSNASDGYGIGGSFIGGYKGLTATVSPTGNNIYYAIDAKVIGGSGKSYGLYASANGTGTNYGIYAKASQGRQNFAIVGETDLDYDMGSAGFLINDNPNGIGLFALGGGVSTYYIPVSGGAGIAATGDMIGIIGFTEKNDDNAVAIMGKYKGTTLTNATGVYGYSAPQPNKSKGIGVKGIGGKYGVYGKATNNRRNSYAVFADGDIGTSASRAFMIDYPLDPANAYLKHFSIESNEVLNIYRGIIKLDKKGQGVVKLPEYLNVVNTNFSYTLTPIGHSAPGLYISKEIKNNNNFQIAGGKPNQKISWVVYAERNDPYFKKYPEKRKNIIKKDKTEQGKYLMPELYNKDESYKITPLNLNRKRNSIKASNISEVLKKK